MLCNKNTRVALIAGIILLFASNLCMAQGVRSMVKWVVEKNSRLSVEGKSNVNTFTCNINEYAKKDTIHFVSDPTKPVRLHGNLQMDIMSFDCNSGMVTKDLRKTLKASTHPQMIIRFISLNCTPQLQKKTEHIKGWIQVELAGVVKTFEIAYDFTVASDGYIQLNGARSFCFSDFKLTPPKKLAGLVKIKDGFDVNFQLVLRSI